MGINKIILVIILFGVLNVISITYSISNTYRMAKKEGEKLKIQKAKIDQLSPEKS